MLNTLMQAARDCAAQWKRLALRAAPIVLTVCLAACGGGGSGPAPGSGTPGPLPETGAPGADYFPLAVGDRWSYQSGGRAINSRVTGTRVVDGRNVAVVASDDPDEGPESFYERSPSGVTQVPGPQDGSLALQLGALPLLRLPLIAGDIATLFERTVTGFQDIDGDGRREDLVMRAVATVVGFERLDIAGTSFTQVAHVTTVLTQTARLTLNNQTATITVTSDDWYAPNIGLVRNRSVTRSDLGNETSQQDITAWRVGTQKSESVAPTVTLRMPADGQAVTAVDIRVQFSEEMDRQAGGGNGLSVSGPGGPPVAGQVLWSDDRSLSFVPAAALADGSYTVQLVPAAEDRAGNRLAAAQSWSFRIDRRGPMVVQVVPAAGAVEVPLDSVLRITFDEPPDPATVNTGTVTLAHGLSNTPVSVALDGRVVTVTPLSPLQRGEKYLLSVSGYLRDTVSNASAGFSTTFNTTNGRFALPAALALGTLWVGATEIGDFNGDGLADLVYGQSDQLLLRLQNADGSLAPAVLLKQQEFCTISTLQAGDVDGDGRTDLLVADSCGTYVLRQAGGTLVPYATPSNLESYDVALVPIAVDGRMAVVSTLFDASVGVSRQTAPGVFAAMTLLPKAMLRITDRAVGDVNGDGRADVVLAGYLFDGTGAVVVHYQQADGSFSAAQALAPPRTNAVGLALGDLNGDGRVDIVFSGSNSDSNGTGSYLGILLQRADGTVAAPITRAMAGSPRALRIVDVDRDGRADIVADHADEGKVGVLLQAADGNFGAEALYAATPPGKGATSLPFQYRGLAVGDLTGDGRPDIVLYGGLLVQRATAVGATSAPRSVITRALRPGPAPPTSAR